MRPSIRSRPHICLPCQLKNGRTLLATDSSGSFLHERPTLQLSLRLARSIRAYSTIRHHGIRDSVFLAQDKGQNADCTTPIGFGSTHRVRVRNRSVQCVVSPSTRKFGSRVARAQHRSHTTSSSTTVELSKAQQEELKIVHDLRQKLTQGLNRVPNIKKDPAVLDGIPIDDILKALPQNGQQPEHKKYIQRLGSEWTGKTFGTVKNELDMVLPHRNPQRHTVSNKQAKDILGRLGVTENVVENTSQFVPLTPRIEGSQDKAAEDGKKKPRRSLASMVAPHQRTIEKKAPQRINATPDAKSQAVALKRSKSQEIDAQDLELKSLTDPQEVKLPQLSFDLSRVLFNPGIYHLQDPRSRVYNFDPYLEQLMPMSEFNFEALNPYCTSSEDSRLLKLAREQEKRYVGSSSSMTSVLSQFHFLISQWREISLDNFTRGFEENLRTFTTISRTPAAIFLRYRDGVYAIDADKEYDEPNLLMSMGKSMEKLLTLEKADFEKWRKSNANANELPVSDPEAFHYSHQGRFLLRSQLDVCDPRLPGTGYFDIKTRAVAGVRMNLREHEAGVGYQIKERFGTWESYEREYYDMMRSTFLKYSLQARMGHMDGIFVAYHNTSRIFGFQYIPVSEMDQVLHGQSDECLGDQEFRFSINFVEEILNIGTQAYPEQSLRIHFDAREASVTEPKHYMNVFIEPMAEEDIKTIQESQKAQHDAFERKLLQGEDPSSILEEETSLEDEVHAKDFEANPTTSEGNAAAPLLPTNTIMSRPTGPASSAANKEYLDNILNSPRAQATPKPFDKEVIGLKLTIQNKVNDLLVTRPEDITPKARWSIEYQLERRSKEETKRMYRYCKNRRMSSLKTAMNRGSDDSFIRSIRAMSEQGAQWRKQQDELDAKRERVILYGDRLGER